jgi:hypothetical protein
LGGFKAGSTHIRPFSQNPVKSDEKYDKDFGGTNQYIQERQRQDSSVLADLCLPMSPFGARSVSTMSHIASAVSPLAKKSTAIPQILHFTQQALLALILHYAD